MSGHRLHKLARVLASSSTSSLYQQLGSLPNAGSFASEKPFSNPTWSFNCEIECLQFSGFGVPIGAWLRGPLREWAHAYLNETALSRTGLLDTQVISRVWAAHLAGANGFDYDLWAVLMLQIWLAREQRG
jgi:Asparagine synthase